VTDELTDVYESGEPRLVIRLSRTASGVRTYTVGASLPLREGTDGDAGAISRVFAVDELVRSLIDNPTPGPSLHRQLAAATTVAAMPAAGKADAGAEWITAAELAAKMGKSRRTLGRYVADGIAAGAIEAKIGGGRGKPTLYRVVQPA
jgi:hypothetical protein